LHVDQPDSEKCEKSRRKMVFQKDSLEVPDLFVKIKCSML